jgi:NAD(P)-dependent dehydrogenase (short-subunit alcohol dehydrogenase family)
MSELAGKGALVTGASRGIGQAVAEAFAAAGAEVTCVARDAERLAEMTKSIASDGHEVTARVGDVSDGEFMQAVVDEMPRLDILVNNAGINILETLTELRRESIEAILQTNVAALMWVTRMAARRMIAEGTKGVVISLSSMLGHVGGPGRPVYTASKHAVEGFTKAIAGELGPYGIRALTIAPAYINTDMMASRLSDPVYRAAAEASIALGRVGEPHEIADLAVFLASDKAAFITGTSVVIDGGFTAV